MRKPFLVITVLAALAAAAFGAFSREPRYFTRLTAADLAEGHFPRRHLASSIEEVNLSAGLERFIAFAGDGAEQADRLAIVEMRAAGVLSRNPDPHLVSAAYEQLIEEYPSGPLLHYRYGAYLLAQLQQLLMRERLRPPREGGADAGGEAWDLAQRARMELSAAAAIDPHNSLPLYEIAYSYYALGDVEKAIEWMGRAAEAAEFDPGDDVVIRGCARLSTLSGAPALEGLIATYRASRWAPSYLAARMEALVSGLLSDEVRFQHAITYDDFLDYLVGLEDVSAKLFHSAEVLRQVQASLVTSGLLWRKVAAEAGLKRDGELGGVARTQLAKASYRYLLVGWQRAAAGLPAQQGIVELDIPLDLRLPFSPFAQRLAGGLFMAVLVLAVPALVAAAIALRLKSARQLALSLTTLCVFASLAYVSTFYSVTRERARVARGVARRLKVLRETPAQLRAEGDPEQPGDFRSEIAKAMLPVPNYTFQAGRVLAYIGTRDCYDALIGGLADPKVIRPWEIISVLREETGETFGYDPAGPRSENLEAIQAWREWWQAARNTFPDTPGQAADV